MIVESVSRPAALALGLCLLSSCRHKASADRPDANKNERHGVARVQGVAEALRALNIVVDAHSISINGHRVAARTDLGGGSLHDARSVYQWTRGLRQHWMDMHPHQRFEGRSEVSVPEDLSFFEGTHLVRALARAGYARPMTVHSRHLRLTFDVPILGLMLAGRGRTTLELCYSAGWAARFVSPPSASIRSDWLDHPFSPWGASSRWRPASVASLGNLTKKNCAPSCANVVVAASNARLSFYDALQVVATMLSAQRGARPELSFDRCTPPMPDATASARPRGNPPKLQVGKLSVTGSLPAEVVRRIVRVGAFNRFRRCYEEASGHRPGLEGRVTTQFTIEANGSVSNAHDAGSDLPDQAVVRCVVAAFSSLSFPEPPNGSASVVYPLWLGPRDG